MTSTSETDLDVLRPLALDALREIAADGSIGEFADHEVADDGVVTLRFRTTQLGYPGWFWTVALAVVDGGAPTVLETELLPGDDALLAPEWVPWSQRLEEYKAQQAAEAERRAAEEASDPADDGSDDDFDDDSDDDAGDGSEYLHAGDVDGVDIDQLDDESDEDDDDSDED